MYIERWEKDEITFWAETLLTAKAGVFFLHLGCRKLQRMMLSLLTVRKSSLNYQIISFQKLISMSRLQGHQVTWNLNEVENQQLATSCQMGMNVRDMAINWSSVTSVDLREPWGVKNMWQHQVGIVNTKCHWSEKPKWLDLFAIANRWSSQCQNKWACHLMPTWFMLWTEHLWPSIPNSYVETLLSQCCSIKRWGLWEVIRIR